MQRLPAKGPRPTTITKISAQTKLGMVRTTMRYVRVTATSGLGAMLLDAIADIGSASAVPRSVPTRTICIVSTADSNKVGATDTSCGYI